MKIAQVAPLMESVPPRLYGGTERIVSYLTEALVEQGHDVTLFASGDSITSARLVPCCTAGPAPQCGGARPHPLLHADARQGAAAGPRVRHHPLPHRPVPLPDLPRHRPSHDHDAARPAGPARHAAALRGLSRDAAGVDLECAAQARARRLLSRHRPSRPAARSARAHDAPARRLSRLPRPHLAGEARRPRDPHRARGRHAAQDRGQGRSRRRGVLQDGDRAHAGWARRRVHRRDRRAPQEELPRRGARRCCSRSTGRSPSAS